MYAIIKTGGKQYQVKKDDIIDVELLHVDNGAQVEFTEVLFVANGDSKSFGAPVVSGCIVKGEVVGSSAGPKILSVKYKRSHHQYRKFGHRQKYSRVKITQIAL